MTSINHYNKFYFNWQSEVGLFGAIANQIKFKSFIKNNQNVLDFGCGGGYMLSTFKNIKKYGVANPYQSDKIKQKIKNTNIEYIKTVKKNFDFFIK